MKKRTRNTLFGIGCFALLAGIGYWIACSVSKDLDTIFDESSIYE